MTSLHSKASSKGLSGLEKAKHDLLNFVTAKQRRFSYDTASIKASNRAKKAVTDRLRKQSATVPMLVQSEAELAVEQAKLISKHVDCLRRSDHLPITANVRLSSPSSREEGGSDGVDGPDQYDIRVVSQNVQEFVEDGLNIYAAAMPFLKGTKGSGKTKHFVSAMMSAEVVDAHAEAVVQLCVRALEGEAANGERCDDDAGVGKRNVAGTAAAVCLQEVDPYLLDVLKAAGSARLPPWKVHACEDALKVRAKSGGCLGITCIVSALPFEPLPDVVVQSTGKGAKVRRFARVCLCPPPNPPSTRAPAPAPAPITSRAPTFATGAASENISVNGNPKASAAAAAVLLRTPPVVIVSVHVRHYDGAHAWPELKGLAGLSKGGGALKSRGLSGGRAGSKRGKGYSQVQPDNSANIAVAELMLRDAAAEVIAQGGALIAVGDFNGPMRSIDGSGSSNAMSTDSGSDAANFYGIVAKAIRKRKISESNEVQDAVVRSKAAVSPKVEREAQSATTEATRSCSGGALTRLDKMDETSPSNSPPVLQTVFPSPVLAEYGAMVTQSAPETPTQYGKSKAIDGCMVVSVTSVGLECALVSDN